MTDRTRAVALMHRFGVDAALIGDLVEQAERRSVAWRWRQTFSAIGQTVIAVARENVAQTAATAIISATALAVWFGGTLWLYDWESGASIVRQLDGVNSRLPFFAWDVYCVPLHMAWSLGCAFIGLLVARAHRRHAAPIVLLCAVVQLPVIIWFGWPYVIAVVRPSSLHLTASTAFYIGWVTDLLITLIVLPLCMVGAGLHGAGHERP